MPSDRASERAAGTADRVLLAVAVGFVALLLGQLLLFEYGRDHGIYAVVADGLLRGELPYRDVWDFKPPGVYLAFALSRVFGTSMVAVRIAEALSLLALAAAFVQLARREFGQAAPGILASAIAIGALVALDFWSTAQPECFGAPLVAWAFVFASHRQPSARRLAAAGLLYGMAALMKPPLGGGALVAAVYASHALRRSGASDTPALRRLWPWGVLGAASLAPVAGVVAAYWLAGALPALVETFFVFTPGYTAQGLGLADYFEMSRLTLMRWAFGSSLLALPGLIALFALPAVAARERSLSGHALAIIGLLLVGVVLQAKGFDYHFATALALTGWLAGVGTWKAWLAVRDSGDGRAIFAMLWIGWIAGAGLWHPASARFVARSGKRIAALRADPIVAQAIRDRLYSTRTVRTAANRRVAAWLRQNTQPDDTIFVWGFEPVVYVLAQRRPASRYVYNVPQRSLWRGQYAARDRLLSDLRAASPAAVVIEEGDELPDVTGLIFDSRQTLARFPELAEWLDANYEAATRIENLEILVRRAGS